MWMESVIRVQLLAKVVKDSFHTEAVWKDPSFLHLYIAMGK